MFAILQTAIHLFYDYDRVFLPIRKKLGSTEQRPLLATSPIAQLKTNAPFILQRVVVRVGVLGVLSPFLYAIFIRKIAWNWTYAFASMMWDIPFAEELSYIPPYHISLILRAMSSSLLLALIWESSSMIFTAYVAQEPLTKGVPLTDESPDPNGVLLNGLKSHKNVVKVDYELSSFLLLFLRC